MGILTSFVEVDDFQKKTQHITKNSYCNYNANYKCCMTLLFRQEGISVTNFNLTGKLFLLLTVQMQGNQFATRPTQYH